MTTRKRNRILSSLLTATIMGISLLTAQLIYVSTQYESVQLDFDTLVDNTEETLLAQKVSHVSLMATEVSKRLEVEQALSIALSKNALLLTLSGKSMGEWTVTEILETRDMFDSIPYGSPFEGGHFVTGKFGSLELAGTYWKDSGHRGIDIFPNSGVKNEIVRSVIDGRVITWGRDDRVYGNYLVIESLDGQYQIKFAHLSSIAIFLEDGTVGLYEGMEFKRGTRIARMGNTGKSTGPHLHMEYSIHSSTEIRLLNADTIIEYTGE